MTAHTIRERVAHHLRKIYRDHRGDEIDALADRVLHAAGAVDGPGASESSLPGSDEVLLITYGDTFVHADRPHLQSLGEIWRDHLADVFSTLHVLPFFPSSSDGGFAVVDYRSIAPALGDWGDLTHVVADDGLMVDLVCNHGSAQSEWFADFVANRSSGRDYYLTADPATDLSAVTRPRTHPLLTRVDTAAGPRHVWATFSHDQVDFDFANPDVLIEFCTILGYYLTQGATRVRLDAIAYLWKQVGTPCVHLPETHHVIKLMRALVEARDPKALLITETNVPHGDNISYFGDGDEAHVVYNFTLAPLIVWSLIAGRGDTLTNWLGRLAPPPDGCTFLNFLASHDGIGLRPVEDLISLDELAPMIQAAIQVGGDYSDYSAPGGPRPYELNVSLADLLAGSDGATADRYVLAHALMLAVQGIPAVYVHSVLASPGDVDAVAATGHKRDINRSRVPTNEAHSRLTQGWSADTFEALAHLIQTRRAHRGFDPESPQTVHVFDERLVVIERGTGDDVVLAIHNVSNESVSFDVPDGFGLHDLLTDQSLERSLTLGAWQAVWLTWSAPASKRRLTGAG